MFNAGCVSFSVVFVCFLALKHSFQVVLVSSCTLYWRISSDSFSISYFPARMSLFQVLSSSLLFICSLRILFIGLLCAPTIVGMLRPHSRVNRYSGVYYTPPSSPVICLSNPTFHSYTKDELLRYSNPVYSGRCAEYLDPSVLGRILDCGIGKTPTTKQRGKRAGKFRDRSIKFKESKRRSVNISNVIYPECTGLPGRSPVKFTMALINLHSICAKIPMVLDHFVESNLDVCLVTETWIKEIDDITRGKLNVGGIKFLVQ